MRVLHLNEHLDWVGGVETYLLNLLPALESHGVACCYAFARGRSELVNNSVCLPELARFGPRSEHLAYKLVTDLIHELKPDLIHIHRIYNLGAIRACLDHKPTVVTCHDYLYLCPAGSFFFRRTKGICQRRAGPACFFVTVFRHCMTLRPRYAVAYYRRVQQFRRWRDRFAAVLCPSDYVRDRLLQVGFDTSRAKTLPYFCPTPPCEYPRRLPAKPTILFLGRIRPIKGYDIFVEALAKLGDVRGILVGDVNDGVKKTILQLATKHRCAERLEVRPWADRATIPALFAETTVFVFPSIWPETLGIVGLEALAHGVPVVASDVGGVRQWLKDGVNGILVPPKDSSALAHAVGRLISSPDLLSRMGEAGLATIRKGFLPGQHVARMVQIYEEALGR